MDDCHGVANGRSDAAALLRSARASDAHLTEQIQYRGEGVDTKYCSPCCLCG